MSILCKHIRKKHMEGLYTTMNIQANYVNLVVIRFSIFLHLGEVTAQRVSKL